MIFFMSCFVLIFLWEVMWCILDVCVVSCFRSVWLTEVGIVFNDLNEFIWSFCCFFCLVIVGGFEIGGLIFRFRLFEFLFEVNEVKCCDFVIGFGFVLFLGCEEVWFVDVWLSVGVIGIEGFWVIWWLFVLVDVGDLNKVLVFFKFCATLLICGGVSRRVVGLLKGDRWGVFVKGDIFIVDDVSVLLYVCVGDGLVLSLCKFWRRFLFLSFLFTSCVDVAWVSNDFVLCEVMFIVCFNKFFCLFLYLFIVVSVLYVVLMLFELVFFILRNLSSSILVFVCVFCMSNCFMKFDGWCIICYRLVLLWVVK